LDKPTRFVISDYLGYLARCRDAGICFARASDAGQLLDCGSTPHVLKHDLHHDLDSAVRMAEGEQRLGIVASYFMMHRHPVNEGYFDRPATWRELRRIQAMGHEIGLHVDGFLLIETYGDLAAAIVAEMRRFSNEGAVVRGGNTHGNTKYYQSLNFEPTNFYAELTEENHCIDPRWNAHYGRYSLRALGFAYWADPIIWYADGRPGAATYYISDNSTQWRVRLLSDPDRHWQELSPRFDLTDDAIEKALANVATESCCYLIHPQFYRAAN